MCKIFQKIDEIVRRFVYWYVFFGLVSAAMSGVASYIAPIAKYGWGAVVFTGVSAGCIITIVASGALMAWRYFNPIPGQSNTIESAERGSIESNRRALIAEARDFMSRTVRQNPDDIYFQNQLESDPIFYILRPHLSDHFHRALMGRVVLYPSRLGATLPQTAWLFMAEIDRLEKEWNLV